MMKVYPVDPLRKETIESHGVKILSEFDHEAIERPKKLNVTQLIDTFLTKKYGWGLDIREDLPPDILGLSNPQSKTICISEETYKKLPDDGRSRFTGCHEFAHVVLHRNQMHRRMITLNPTLDYYFRSKREELKSYIDPEWQADYLAGVLLMPRPAVKSLMARYNDSQLVGKMVEIFGVSRIAAEVRLQKMP